METYKYPLSCHTKLSKKFYERCKDDILLYQKCINCHEIIFPLQKYCPKCNGRNLRLKESKGIGKINTFTVIHDHDPFDLMGDGELPYACVLVDMDEGFRIYSYIVECNFDELQRGMPVEVIFDTFTKELTFIKFRPIKA